MDPYLEGPMWSSVHSALCNEIARHLTPKLRPKYIAMGNERQVLSVTEAWVDQEELPEDQYPDVAVVQSAGPGRAGPSELAGGAAAPVEVATLIPSRVPHVTIEIRDVEERRLVTSIEVLSPTNKRGDGHDEYVQKRNRVLVSKAHLLEIDLLRRGRRVPTERPLPPAPYYVFLSRLERRPIMQVWPIQLDQPLPDVPVPLLPGDPDVMLELQKVLATTYDAHGYDLAVDYTQPPRVPLRPDELRWAQQRLKAARERE
jgi:hypothetical protein